MALKASGVALAAAAERSEAHYVPAGGHADLYDFGVSDRILGFLDGLGRAAA